MVYDDVYYINLDSSIIRNEKIIEIFKQNNIEAKRYSAVDGNKLNKEEVKQYFEKEDFVMPFGNLGTLLTHTNLWKEIQKEDKEVVLILEDDIIFNHNFKSKLENHYKEVPDDWDMIYIGSNKLKGENITSHVLKPIEGNFIGYNSGMFGYLIKKSSIDKLLNIVFPLPSKFNCIDVIIRSNFSKLNCYFLTEKMITHNDGFVSERLTRNR